MTDVCSNRKDGLPPSGRVRTDDGMHSLQDTADVLWRAASLVVELESATLRSFVELWLSERGRQRFNELLPGWREAVVDLVARSPQRVCQPSLASGAVNGKVSKSRKAILPPPVLGS